MSVYVRQHIGGFLGVDLQRHMLQNELRSNAANAGSTGLTAGPPGGRLHLGRSTTEAPLEQMTDLDVAEHQVEAGDDRLAVANFTTVLV